MPASPPRLDAAARAALARVVVVVGLAALGALALGSAHVGCGGGFDPFAVDLGPPCTTNAQCADAGVCDVTSAHCVGCLSDENCAPGTLCDPQKRTCNPGCGTTHACPAGLVCNVTESKCVDCLADADCAGTKRPVCDVPNHACVLCVPGPDTCGRLQICARQSPTANAPYVCVPGCDNDSECPSTPDAGTCPMANGCKCEPRSHACIACRDDADCAPHELCRLDKCVPGCSVAKPCPASLLCCDSACIDPLADPTHCGTCAAACGPMQTCADGGCI